MAPYKTRVAGIVVRATFNDRKNMLDTTTRRLFLSRFLVDGWFGTGVWLD